MRNSCVEHTHEMGEGRRPATWGRGRSGWGDVHNCAGRWPGCGPCPRLGFATRGRWGPSQGVLGGSSVCHVLGRGTVRCRAGARRRWSYGMRGPGSGGHGWRALGCTQCLRWQGEGAAPSRPALQGFLPWDLLRVTYFDNHDLETTEVSERYCVGQRESGKL